MRLCVAGVMFALQASLAAHSAADGLDEVMHSLAQRRHGEASFVEQHFLSLLKRPVESSGELVYDAPDRAKNSVASASHSASSGPSTGGRPARAYQ